MYDLITYITQYLEYESYISSLTMLSIKNQRIVKIQRMNLEYKKYYIPYYGKKQNTLIIFVGFKLKWISGVYLNMDSTCDPPPLMLRELKCNAYLHRYTLNGFELIVLNLKIIHVHKTIIAGFLQGVEATLRWNGP